MSLEIGQAAPEFELLANDSKKVKLSDFRGKYVVVYFYPKDMTPGCTTQACDFRDNHESFEELDAVILGISPDPIERHQKFIDKHDLPFMLLVDDEHKVAEAYDVWKLKKMFGREYMGIERSTFLIDKEGKLMQEWRKVRVKGHVEEALEYLRENV